MALGFTPFTQWQGYLPRWKICIHLLFLFYSFIYLISLQCVHLILYSSCLPTHLFTHPSTHPPSLDSSFTTTNGKEAEHGLLVANTKRTGRDTPSKTSQTLCVSFSGILEKDFLMRPAGRKKVKGIGRAIGDSS